MVGTVADGQPEAQAGHSLYQDWTLEVEQYLTEPLPHDSLTIRTFTGALDAGGNVMPVKSPALAQGQRVLLFLEKDWDDPPLTGHEFTIVDLFGGTFWIRDERVSVRYFDEPEEYADRALEDVIGRITSMVEMC